MTLILPEIHDTDQIRTKLDLVPQGFWFVDPGILLENRTKFYSSKTKSWYKSKKPQNATIDFNEIDNLINIRLSPSVMDQGSTAFSDATC